MESPLENVVIITIWFFVHFHRIPGSDSSGSADLLFVAIHCILLSAGDPAFEQTCE